MRSDFDRDTLQILEFITDGTFGTPNQKAVFTYDDGTNITVVRILDATDTVDVTSDNIFLTDEGGYLVFNNDNFITFSTSSSSSSSRSSSSSSSALP
jgi:hypothetical protein